MFGFCLDCVGYVVLWTIIPLLRTWVYWCLQVGEFSLPELANIGHYGGIICHRLDDMTCLSLSGSNPINRMVNLVGLWVGKILAVEYAWLPAACRLADRVPVGRCLHCHLQAGDTLTVECTSIKDSDGGLMRTHTSALCLNLFLSLVAFIVF